MRMRGSEEGDCEHGLVEGAALKMQFRDDFANVSPHGCTKIDTPREWDF